MAPHLLDKRHLADRHFGRHSTKKENRKTSFLLDFVDEIYLSTKIFVDQMCCRPKEWVIGRSLKCPSAKHLLAKSCGAGRKVEIEIEHQRLPTFAAAAERRHDI